MRRTSLFAIVGLAVIGLVAAGASTAGSAPGLGVGRVLRLVQGAPEVAFVDLADPGPSPGDVLVFRSELLDHANARVAAT